MSCSGANGVFLWSKEPCVIAHALTFGLNLEGLDMFNVISHWGSNKSQRSFGHDGSVPVFEGNKICHGAEGNRFLENFN